MKNIGSLFISQTLGYVIVFIYTIYLIRYLGVENFGILSFALALTSILEILSDLGLNILMTRDVARDKSLTQKYFNNIIGIKLILLVILVSGTVLGLNLMSYPLNEIYVIYLILFMFIFNTFSGVFYSLFQAYEKLEYQSIANILNSILMLAGVLLIIKFNSGLILLSILYALIGGLVLLFYVYISLTRFKFPKPRFEFDFNFWKPTLAQALQFGLIGVFTTIYVWIDSVMLSFMVGNEAVGIYNAAYRIVLILLFIPVVINAAVFPVMSRLYGSSSDSLQKITEKYFKFMLLISIPMGILITFFAGNIILLLFGNQYYPSVIALQILIWATVLTFINSSYVQLFQSSDKQMTVTKIAFIGMIINISLNLLLIPKYSYIAASFNTLVTEISGAVLILTVATRNNSLNPRKVSRDFVKISISGLVMFSSLVIFKELNIFILVIISTIIYLAVIYITRTIDKEDIRIIKQIRG
jgi:O-antigen/teichoic acid export membrane protein